MRAILFILALIPATSFAQHSRTGYPEASLRAAISALRRAVDARPEQRQFHDMLAKAQRVGLNHSGNGSSCRNGAAAYVTGGNTIYICPNFYSYQKPGLGRFIILHELAHLTARFSISRARADGECMADYVAYKVLDAIGADKGPSGYDQRCGGSSRDWRPPR